MILIYRVLFLVAVINFLPMAIIAQEYNIEDSMLCSIIDVIECHPGGECIRSDASSVNLPFFVNVDLSKKEIRSPQKEGKNRLTPIASVTQLDGKIILQGAEDNTDNEEDAVGWTMSIDADDGRMIFSATREKAGFMIFGACTKP